MKNPQIQEAQHILMWISKKKSTTGHMLITPKNTRNKKILKIARETRLIIYEERIITLVTAFSNQQQKPEGSRIISSVHWEKITIDLKLYT